MKISKAINALIPAALVITVLGLVAVDQRMEKFNPVVTGSKAYAAQLCADHGYVYMSDEGKQAWRCRNDNDNEGFVNVRRMLAQ